MGSCGAAVRDLVSNCELSGSVSTNLPWCALLNSSKQNKTTVKCLSQFLAFNFTE